MPAESLRKGAVSRKALLTALMKGVWTVVHETVSQLSRGITLTEHEEVDRLAVGRAANNGAAHTDNT